MNTSIDFSRFIASQRRNPRKSSLRVACHEVIQGNYNFPGLLRFWLAMTAFGLFGLTWLISPAQALTNVEAYKAQLPIITAESAPSDAELKVALAQVLEKLTGEQDIETNPDWRNSLNRAKDWMLSYQYIPANDTHPLILEVDFDPQAISNLLKSKAPASLATSTSSVPANQIQVIVYGIGDLSAMDGLKSSLRALPSVEQVEVTELSPDEVILNIKFQGGRGVLQQEIAEELNTLAPVTESSPSNDTLTYQWAI